MSISFLISHGGKGQVMFAVKRVIMLSGLDS